MNKIISRENSKLKHAKKVRDGKVDRKIFIEGARLTAEALRSAVQIEEALVSSDFAGSERSARLIDDLSTRGIPLSEMDNRLFQSLADTKNSQGIALICSRPDTSFSAFAAGYRTGAGLAILLNEINNPSNVGAILRTAEAAGVSEIVVSNDSTDVYSPKALRASMGSGLRLNIWENAGFDEAVSWFRENGCVVTAADVGAKRNYTK
jgi:rRNA methylases